MHTNPASEKSSGAIYCGVPRLLGAWLSNCFHAQSLAKVTQLQDLIFGEENIRRLQITENDATLASEHPNA